MEILFNEIIARSYNRWAETPLGRQAYGPEEKLLLRLGKLAAGKKIFGAIKQVFIRCAEKGPIALVATFSNACPV